jgi:hypothetical protein
MFTLEIYGLKYRAYFKYEQIKKTLTTTCTIVELLGDQSKIPDSAHKVICRGVAVCNPPDRFDKYFGRKLSLKRALDFFTRDTRTEFWNKYWSISKK